MKLSFTILTLAIVVGLATSVQARDDTPEGGFSFGEAKAHGHVEEDFYTFSTPAPYCGRGLITDPSNNTGNIFFGNTICAVLWDDVWFWYDWSTDFDAAEKIAVLDGNHPYGTITVTYDSVCMLAVEVTTDLCCQ